MRATQLLELFRQNLKRTCLVGDESGGVIAALDLEGRLYACLDDEVLNRVNPAAMAGVSRAGTYLNPGGDGLWPAPEGTRLGYFYSTGAWRVPPSLSAVRYELTSQADGLAVIQAELDLINAQGLGVPVQFERRIQTQRSAGRLTLTVTESITCMGDRDLTSETCLLAPWTLCQFDCGPECHVIFPDAGPQCVWDLYDPSDDYRSLDGGTWRIRTDGTRRFQLGIGAGVPWIEFRDPRRRLRAHRTAEAIAPELRYIDIADRPPAETPDPRGVRFSVYSDASGFMEIEAAGGCPAILKPHARLEVRVTTEYLRD